MKLQLFGPLHVEVNGLPLAALRSRKGRWLLAILTLRRSRAVERTWLAGALWPESDECQALQYLRVSLTDLRHALNDEAWRLRSPTRQTLSLDLAGADVDLVAFDDALACGAPGARERAVELYHGPLLEGCDENWILAERGQRERQYLRALESLASDSRRRGDLSSVIDYHRRIVATDPLSEAAHRGIMEALAAGGNHAEATAAYRDLRALLLREHHHEPSPATVQLFQAIQQEGRPRAPRPAQSAAASPDPPRRLPKPLSSLVGRDEEIREIGRQFESSRLVTLSGPGGIGKTRLAIRVAEGLAQRHADGACFVDLAPIVDPARVSQAVAEALRIQESPGSTPTEGLVDYLQRKLLLLVFDNCEHVLEPCARLAYDLLQSCANLHILVTSQRALDLPAEIVYRVPPLTIPDCALAPSSDQDLIDDLARSGATRLFLDRAKAANPAFGPTPEIALAVLDVCRQLDGIPLAIELAAARIRVLDVHTLSELLDDRLQILAGGSRNALPRHRTMEAAIEWSFGLLSEAERALLCRLSIFAGGWPLDAVGPVCMEADSESWEALDLLTGLVDKSLVEVKEDRSGRSRYRLLEPIRRYAQHRLRLSGDSESVRHRHRDWYLRWAERAETETDGVHGTIRLDPLFEEQDNLRAAMDGCIADGDAHSGLRLAAALGRFWLERGSWNEGRERMAQLLAMPGAVDHPSERARVLRAAGALASEHGDHAIAQSLFEASLQIYRALGDRRGISAALRCVGNQSVILGQTDAARQMLEEALTLARDLGERQELAACLDSLGVVTYHQGDSAHADALFVESLALYRRLGNKKEISHVLGNLGVLACDRGEYDRAATLEEEAISLRRELPPQSGVGFSLRNLAAIARAQGDYEQAVSLYNEALVVFRRFGQKAVIVECVSDLARIDFARGDLEHALQLCEEALCSLALDKDRSHAAHLLDFMAGLAIEAEELGRAIELLDRAEAHRPPEDRYCLGSLLTKCGRIALFSRDDPTARSYFEEALGIWRELGRKSEAAAALSELAALPELPGSRSHFPVNRVG